MSLRLPGIGLVRAVVALPAQSRTAVRGVRRAVVTVDQLLRGGEVVLAGALELIVGLKQELQRIDGVVTSVELEVLRVDVVVSSAADVLADLADTREQADAQVRGIGSVVDEARVEVGRLGELVITTSPVVDRLGGVLDRADHNVSLLRANVIASAGTAITEASELLTWARNLLGLVDPPVQQGAPLLGTLTSRLSAETVEHVPELIEEVHAAMPDIAVLREVAENLIPMVSELQQTLSGLPGAARLKRRAQQHAEE